MNTADIETAYSNMPPYGIAAVTAMVPVPRGMHSAAARMGATDKGEPAVPPYRTNDVVDADRRSDTDPSHVGKYSGVG